MAAQVRKLTQRELARGAGMAETQIGVLLHRLQTSPMAVELSTLQRIAKAADVDFNWLVTGRAPDDGAARAPRLADHRGWTESIEYLHGNGAPTQPAVLEWLASLRMNLPAEIPLDWGFLRDVIGAYVFWNARQQPELFDRSIPRAQRSSPATGTMRNRSARDERTKIAKSKLNR